MTTKYKCPDCGFPVPLSERDLPFNCRCGAVYFFLDELLSGAKEHLAWRVLLAKQAQGPGTEFELLASEIGVTSSENCTCARLKESMNRLGAAGCRQHRGTLAAAVKKNYATLPWVTAIRAGWNAKWLVNPLDPFGSLIDEAVRRAEDKQAEAIRGALADLQGPPQPRAADWRHRPEVIAAQRQLLADLVATPHQPPEEFSGRGIVTLGGTAKYFGAAYVLVSVLRKLGCNLPVEWWFLGPEELDPRMLELAEQLGNVQCVNLFERVGKYGRQPRRIAGWEAKAWAILYSRFAEVLFLDADNVPARNPAYLFDTQKFQQAGTLAWPDFPPEGWSITETAFQVAGLPVPARATKPEWHAPTDYAPWETGQLLVDKRRAWHALEVWAALSDQSDFWYPREFKGAGLWYVYGDKDLAYLAWETTRTPYALQPNCTFAGNQLAGAFLQRDPAGEVVFQHRVQPATKWKLHETNLPVPGGLHHDLCLAALDQLRSQWVGHVWDAGEETAEERAFARQSYGEIIWFRGDQPARLRLDASRQLPDGQRWTVRQVRGEWRLAIATFDRVLAFFGRDDKGNWSNHGTGQFLMPSPPPQFELPFEPAEIAIWNDIINANEYRLPDSFDPPDVILDVGGHCGIFAWACLQRGAGRVVSVEPAPENFARLASNLFPFGGRSSRVPAAAWHSAGELFLEQKEGARHTGGWSAIGTTAGIRVTAVSFEQLVESAAAFNGRPLRLVKLDCEGSEWPLLEHFTRWDLVEAWCGEYHHATADEARQRLQALLGPHGLQVIVEPHPDSLTLGHFWAAR